MIAQFKAKLFTAVLPHRAHLVQRRFHLQDLPPAVVWVVSSGANDTTSLEVKEIEKIINVI